MGKIPALRRVQYPNRLSINYGRAGNDPAYGTVSAEEIPNRVQNYDHEMLNDLLDLLRRRSTPTMPLGRPVPVDPPRRRNTSSTKPVRSFHCRHRAEDDRPDDFAICPANRKLDLLNLLDRIQNPDVQQQPPAPEPPEPELSPDERDFRSIVDVLEKNGRTVSMAVLGKSSRRWLERPPRDPSSPQPNRLADVLARMVADGVLTKNGPRYVPGPQYSRYLGTPDLVGA